MSSPSCRSDPPKLLFTKEMFIQNTKRPIEQDFEFDSDILGQGAFGTVFKAAPKNRLYDSKVHSSNQNLDLDLSTLKSNALKTVEFCPRFAIKKIDLNLKKLRKEQIQNEIEILSYLDHPSIVRIHSVYKNANSLFIVQDLLTGPSLYSLIQKRQKICQPDARTIFLQLIRAIGYLHGQNICHRDIKPENILFGEKDNLRLRLIDFGLAYCWEENMNSELKVADGQRKKLIGTVDYMSPEQLSFNYDERCDIWAAGVILFNMLSGIAPFSGNSDEEIIANIKGLKYSLEIQELHHVSKEAKDLLSGILKKESQRLSLSEILDHPWFVQTQETFTKQSRETANSLEEGDSSFEDIGSCRNESHNSSETDCDPEERFKLTVNKMQFFSVQTVMVKLASLHSAASQSGSITNRLQDEFFGMDFDGDGVISVEDLNLYLAQNGESVSNQKLQALFQSVDLNNRGFICYSEYVACILAWNNQSNHQCKTEESSSRNIDSNSTLLDTSCSSDNSENKSKGSCCSEEPLDCDDFSALDLKELQELFYLLDQDEDGYITQEDFASLFKKNGIFQENQETLRQIRKLIKLFNQRKVYQESHSRLDQEYVLIKAIGLPNSYKGEKDGGKKDLVGLSNAYKGDKDGGIDTSHWRSSKPRLQGGSSSERLGFTEFCGVCRAEDVSRRSK